MLHEHLVAKTRPQTAAQNLVFWKKWRISVLSDRLFRIERSENGEITEEIADGSDEYVFAFGDDYRAAVKALYMITGAPPSPHRSASHKI